MLWHFTGESAPAGDIGAFTDKEIADAVGWKGRPPKLIDALCAPDSRWLDRNEAHRLIVHDWPTHAEYEVCRTLDRNKKDFLDIYGVSVRSRLGKNAELPRKSLGDSEEMRASREAKAKALGSVEEFQEEQKATGTDILTAALSLRFDGFPGGQDESFRPFVEAYCATGRALIPKDFSDAHWTWRNLDFEHKLLAVNGVKDRVATGYWSDPTRIHLPANYLKGEYLRAIPAVKKPQDLTSKMQEIRRKREQFS